jgi:hypothetical protein
MNKRARHDVMVKDKNVSTRFSFVLFDEVASQTRLR